MLSNGLVLDQSISRSSIRKQDSGGVTGHNKTKRPVCRRARDLLTLGHVSAALREVLRREASGWKQMDLPLKQFQRSAGFILLCSLNERLACLLTCVRGDPGQLKKQSWNPLKLLIETPRLQD